MFGKIFRLLKVDLQMFDDGEVEAPPSIEGSEQSVIAPQSRSTNITSSRTQANNDLANVVYGKTDAGEGGESTPNAQGTEVDKKVLWAEIKEQYKDLYGEDVQSIIKDRFKKNTVTEQRLGQVDPIISMLMEKYEAKDETHLLELVQNENLEAYADREGLTLEQAKETHNVKNENKALKKQLDEFATKDQQEVINQQIGRWRSEETAIQKDTPDFKLDSFVENEKFMKLLEAGIDMKTVYQVLNLDSIIAKTVKATQKNTVDNIKARGTSKVPEAGAKNTPGLIVKSDVNSHTREDRAEINRRVARGEIIKL